ncbi:MAG: hypothetical protein U0526_00035 [Candidatus Saccharibacteria bacterium]
MPGATVGGDQLAADGTPIITPHSDPAGGGNTGGGTSSGGGGNTGGGTLGEAVLQRVRRYWHPDRRVLAVRALVAVRRLPALSLRS